MKLHTKKELATLRQEISKTGGGPKPPSPTPEAIEISEMIPQEFVVDSNIFDIDGIDVSVIYFVKCTKNNGTERKRLWHRLRLGKPFICVALVPLCAIWTINKWESG